MEPRHTHQENLLRWIDLEIKEQQERYKSESGSSLAHFRSLGILLYPITITRKTFGYADYPEVAFRLNFPTDTSNFRDGAAIECFIEGEEPIKGVLSFLDGKSGSLRLFAPDFPDWIEDKGVGVKLAPDHYTSERMQDAVKNISSNPLLNKLFLKIAGEQPFDPVSNPKYPQEFFNKSLNESQQNAVAVTLEADELTVLHGPPGTGKTTTLLESIEQLVQLGKRVLVTAPSNAAVDNVAMGLLGKNVQLLRVGNTEKVHEAIFPFTPEGHLQDSKERKEIKRLKIQAEEYRRMAMQYKRSFGREEREQRNLLMKEVRSIRDHIKSIRNYADQKALETANVVLGTPVGIYNALKKEHFDVLVIDEAGQLLEPLAWLVFPFADRWILAGDPFQLPPTVISKSAAQKGLEHSILERCFEHCPNIYLLDTQYRMRSSIVGFSNAYFYQGRIKTPQSQGDVAEHLTFYDTAGTGFEEQSGSEGTSLSNPGELDLAKQIIEALDSTLSEIGFISPYSGQVQEARQLLPDAVRVSTVDSFQGQEMKYIVISLVRSNSEGTIGFLKDYRRMNVALTRAKERLIVIGDSATIGLDPFYSSFLQYVEKNEAYHSAWELMG